MIGQLRRPLLTVVSFFSKRDCRGIDDRSIRSKVNYFLMTQFTRESIYQIYLTSTSG